MQIQMTTGLQGPELSLDPGDVYDAADDEAVRLIEAGFAVPYVEKSIERAVKRRPPETRAAAPEPLELAEEAPTETPAEPETPAETEGEPNA